VYECSLSFILDEQKAESPFEDEASVFVDKVKELPFGDEVMNQLSVQVKNRLVSTQVT